MEPSEIKARLDAVSGVKGLLNDWEKGFVVSITERFAHLHTLTENQQAKLDQIYSEHVTEAAPPSMPADEDIPF